MISLYLGLPGSGKTYAGVNAVYNNFTSNDDAKKDFKKDYISCFTNINEFNFDLCTNVYKFDFNVFYKQLTKLYDMYRKKCTDNELIELAKEFNIYRTLFIIDECHNILNTNDKVLIWWLTYHRHLYHDIFLITQNLALVNAKYKPLAEAFYKARPSSLILNNTNFNYMYYTESRLTKASYVNTVKIKKREAVFKLYHSGDSVKSKNVILRFIYITIGIVFIFILLAYYFYISNENKVNLKKNVNSSKLVSSYSVPDSVPDSVLQSDYDDTSILMVFKCNNEMCSYKDSYFDLRVLSFAKEHFNAEIINTRRLFNYSYVSVSVSSSFLNFLQGGQSNVNPLQISDINPFSNK